MELQEESHSAAAEYGFAAVFALMAVRLVLRIREDGRSPRTSSAEEDFRGLIQSSSDGIAIMDGDFGCCSPRPRPQPAGSGRRHRRPEISFLDLVDPDDRERVRASTLDPRR